MFILHAGKVQEDGFDNISRNMNHMKIIMMMRDRETNRKKIKIKFHKTKARESERNALV